MLAGIGHGVQEWMEQMGARTASPLTTLDEVITVVRRLLHGETVTFQGQEVRLDTVALEQPPSKVPPVLAGVRGRRAWRWPAASPTAWCSPRAPAPPTWRSLGSRRATPKGSA